MVQRTIKLRLKREIEKKYKKLSKKALKASAIILEDEIKKSIARGVSPVEGIGRFKKYSSSYSDAIDSGKYHNKKKRPVNLKLSGGMLKSLVTRPKGLDRIIIKFRSKIADYHDKEGAGKSKILRRLLPKRNTSEKFSRVIMKKVLQKYTDIINKNN